MKDSLPAIILIILLGVFIYFGYYAGFWNVMRTWGNDTWAIWLLSILIAFIARNEIGK